MTDYNMFAGHSIIGTGIITSPGGKMGSNGDLFLSGTNVQAINGGGSLFDNFGAVDTTGDVTVDGNATATFFGAIGGNLNVGHNANLTANIGGNIVAGGTVATSGATTGSIFAGGLATLNPLGTVGGAIHSFSGMTPPSFTPLVIPAAHTFAAGGPDISVPQLGQQTLAPGSYGDFTMAGANTIHLSSGNYYFNDITMTGSFVTWALDTTHGPINIFVTGSVFLDNPTVTLNGVAFSNITAANAAQVFWETHSNFYADFASLVGTVFAPDGDIQLVKLSNELGTLVAGHDIITDGATFTPGAVSPTLLSVPEPSGLVLALVAGAGLLLLNRRKARLPCSR
ncbi:MAG TPA: polymer-forming cytoskeletal protein [Pirellulales bacterium]|nr:polymer-forming cytoskeletal protein [Pirellulales bacterium]